MTQMPRIEYVVDYLRTHGWIVTGQWRNASVWSRHEFDVLVPSDDTLSDSAIRLRELTDCVADAEGRSPRAVLRDLAMPAADVVSYRIPDEADTITLTTGARAIHAVRDLITFCAREAVGDSWQEPRGATPNAVRALLDRSPLSLHEKIFGLDISLPLDEGELEPLGRSTARLLLRYSTAVLDATGSSEADAFERVFRQGVSTAVCVALADLAGPDRRASFELGFHWSRRAPLADRTVEFPRSAGERIRVGSKRVGPVAETGSGVVAGAVTSLSDDGGGDRWRIKVRGVLDIEGVALGEQRLVTVWLGNARDYAAALTAHRDGRGVRAEGTVTRTRRTYGITTSAQGFTVTDRTQM